MARRAMGTLARVWNRYERALSGGALIIGFVFDLFLAKRPDSVLDNAILVSYLFIAAALIIILNLHSVLRREQSTPAPIFLLLVLQFCFGGLSSNLLVLYGKSGTLTGSALFILMLAGMLVGNEFLKTRYAQLRFNIVVLYLLLLTYLIIAVPTFVLHAVGTSVFLASGFASLVIIAMFLALVYVAVFRGRERGQQLYEVSVLVVLVFLLFNALYFLNIIPPVPLSLKDIDVYHSISLVPDTTRTTTDLYTVQYEPPAWYAFWRSSSSQYTIVGTSATAVCFSSVFAPTQLSTPIYHHWEMYDTSSGSWVTKALISFPINGGRSEGYRAFTTTDVMPGEWRCNVETTGGALIGRTTFTVVGRSSLPTFSLRNL